MKGTVVDPEDGSTLAFEVDQGAAHPWTCIGAQYDIRPWLDSATDAGRDLEGGWYIALARTVRF